MAYAIHITEASADFIAEFINDGVAPPVGDEDTYLFLPDSDQLGEPNRILSAEEWREMGMAQPHIYGINIQKF